MEVVVVVTMITTTYVQSYVIIYYVTKQAARAFSVPKAMMTMMIMIMIMIMMMMMMICAPAPPQPGRLPGAVRFLCQAGRGDSGFLNAANAAAFAPTA